MSYFWVIDVFFFNSTNGIEFANFPTAELLFGLTSYESYNDLSAQDMEFGFNETRRDRILRTYVRNVFHFHLKEIYSTLRVRTLKFISIVYQLKFFFILEWVYGLGTPTSKSARTSWHYPGTIEWWSHSGAISAFGLLTQLARRKIILFTL